MHTITRGCFVRVARAGGWCSDEIIYPAMGGKLDHLPESQRKERARKALDRWQAPVNLGVEPHDPRLHKLAAEAETRLELAAQRAERLRADGSPLAPRAEADWLDRLSASMRANERAGVGLRPPGLHRDPEEVYAEIAARAERLRRVPIGRPVKVSYVCPICGGPHPRVDHAGTRP